MQIETYLSRILGANAQISNYLVHWSDRFGYVYVETPKVGCTTVKRMLQLAELDGDAARLPELVHDRTASPLKAPAGDPDAFRRHYEAAGTFRFCFVRNPFSRALSCYLDKFVGNAWERNRLAPELGLDRDRVPGFRAFLEAVAAQPPERRDIHWATQRSLLRPDRFRYSFIGRFESFATQLGQVAAAIGVSAHADLSRRANETGASGRMAEFLGPEEADLVRQIYAEDFTTFSYGWSSAVL